MLNKKYRDIYAFLPALASRSKFFKMLKITIPSPCHENWDNMLPNQDGRHCNSCSKTVVDFTQMNDEEVKNFLISKQHQRLCGRFSSTQLQHIHIELPQNIFQMRLLFWKQFLVASLLVFSTTLFSCQVNTLGAPLQPTELTTGIIALHADTANKNVNMADTVPAKRHWVGKPRVCNAPKDSTNQMLKGEIRVVPEPKALLGEPAYVPANDTVTKKEDPVIMGKMIAVPKKPDQQ